jgi:hypothetical protein
MSYDFKHARKGNFRALRNMIIETDEVDGILT